MSSIPPARFEAEPRGGAATIGKAVKVVGQIFSREDLYVDGEVEGTVEALEHKLTIGPNGKVQEAKVLRSIPLLDASALDAVRQWEFTPTLLNNVPVPVIMTVTVNFTLQ